MKENNKKFNYGLYAVAAFAVVTAIIVIITLFTFKSKYVAFDTDKMAVSFTDSVIQSGDGYNAYKYTLVSKSDKYGDFIRENYIYPIVYPGYSSDLSKDEKKQIKENGFDKDTHKSDATLNDDGTLSGKLNDTMYPYYVELLEQYGWDDYDAVFTNYFNKLVEVRQQIFGDDYMSDEIMFTALEANVASYGSHLTGTEVEYASDGVTVLQDKTIGAYQEKYGEDYKITSTVADSYTIEDLAGYVANLDANVLATYGVAPEDISEVQEVTVNCALDDGTIIATQVVYEVKIGHTWYVDNLTTNTSSIYAVEEAVG